MLNSDGIGVIKEIAPLLVNMIPGGAIFCLADTEKITWKIASDIYDVSALSVGTMLRDGGGPRRSIKEMKVTEEKVPRAAYGMRLIMKSIPIVDAGVACGCFIMVIPRLHPVARAFNDFAPIIADMFPEGAFIYMTDLEKFAYRQSSGKFDIRAIQAGDKFRDDSVASKAINTKQLAIEEFDASVYGVPVMIMNYPLFDEDDSGQVVATFGLAFPGKTLSV
jgi:hypothetical protein